MVFGISLNVSRDDRLVKIAKWTSFVIAVLTLLTGIIHVFASFRRWCSIYEKMNPTVDSSCFGPWLIWNKGGKDGHSFTHDSNNELYYRSVFSLDPNIMFRLWTPFLLGVIALIQHMTSFASQKGTMVSRNWSRVTFWHLFLAFFGNFGWAGNWGVMIGFAICLSLPLFLAVAFMRPDSSTSLGITFAGGASTAAQEEDAGPLYAQDYQQPAQYTPPAQADYN